MKYVRVISKEWEKIVFIMSLVIFLATVLIISLMWMGIFKINQSHFFPSSQLQKIYNEQSFAFLNEEPFDGEHSAFTSQDDKPVTNHHTSSRPNDPPVNNQENKAPVDNNQQNENVHSKPVKLNHFIRYLGYMETPSGALRAWIKTETTKAEQLLAPELHISKKGDLINGYIVNHFDGDKIVLKNKLGETITILKGSVSEVDL